MISEKRRLFSWITIAALFAAVATGGLVSNAAAQDAPEVELIGNEVAVYGDTVANFDVMKVRIANPDGELVLDAQSDGDPVAWSPSAGDPDGLYRYEVVVITRESAVASAADDDETNDQPGVGQVRRSGSFQVQNGAIIEPRDQESSILNGALRLAGVVLDTIGEAIIPSAQAQNVTVSSVTPTIFFNDTEVTAQAFEWQLRAGQGGEGDNEFNLFDDINATVVLEVVESPNNAQSMKVDLNGDIGLADNSVFIDRDLDRVGIGTIIPAQTLHITNSAPAVRMEDTGLGTVIWDIRTDFGDLVIDDVGGGAGPILVVEDIDGHVGIGGELNPAATLEVSRSDGSTQVLIDETSTTTANRTLIQLTNNGRAQVRLSNTATSVNWVTGMGTDDAYIIRRGANEYRFTKGGRVRWFVGGDPNARFDYSNNGNLRIAGTLTENSDVNTKRDIEPVDGASVLARVAALPVSTWTYREDEDGARHMGPIAQDFHAAFGLGADETSISPRDLAGVALAAVKEMLRQKDEELAELRDRVAALEALIAK